MTCRWATWYSDRVGSGRDTDELHDCVQVDLDAMLPGMVAKLQAHGEQRFRQEYPWSRLLTMVLALAIAGAVLTGLLWDGRAFCSTVVVSFAVAVVHTTWRRRRIDCYIRQHLAGQAYCRECGYCLEGLGSANCPECGCRVRL